MTDRIEEGAEIKEGKVLTVKLGIEETRMISALRESPHFINISEFVRASIRHLYESKEKAKKIQN